MLGALPPRVLGRLRFPLAELRKPAVRWIAERHGLAVARRPESQDLCFLAGRGKRAFLREHGGIEDRDGAIVDARTAEPWHATGATTTSPSASAAASASRRRSRSTCSRPTPRPTRSPSARRPRSRPTRSRCATSPCTGRRTGSTGCACATARARWAARRRLMPRRQPREARLRLIGGVRGCGARPARGADARRDDRRARHDPASRSRLDTGPVTSDEIRETYLSYFEQRGHKIVPSASLVPRCTTPRCC